MLPNQPETGLQYREYYSASEATDWGRQGTVCGPRPGRLGVRAGGQTKQKGRDPFRGWGRSKVSIWSVQLSLRPCRSPAHQIVIGFFPVPPSEFPVDLRAAGNGHRGTDKNYSWNCVTSHL